MMFAFLAPDAISTALPASARCFKPRVMPSVKAVSLLKVFLANLYGNRVERRMVGVQISRGARLVKAKVAIHANAYHHDIQPAFAANEIVNAFTFCIKII
jgi:hypothetical protein